MDTISIIRGLYQAHLSERGSDNPDKEQVLTDKFLGIMDKYVRECLPLTVFDGEIPDLLFDESDDGWYGVDISENSDSGDGPVAYRVVESLGETSCEICEFIHDKTLPFQLYEQGVTAPQFHPYCRGLVEVLDRDGNVLFVFSQKGNGEIDDSTLDGIQFVLDLVGLVPGIGEIADGMNALISFSRGNYVDAALSAAAMIPFVGWTSAGGKWLKNILKHADEAADVLKHADEVIDGVAKYGDEIVEGLAKAAKEGAEEAAEAVGKYADDVLEGVEFNGKRVTQNNDLFDPDFIDDKGRTNTQRMEKGLDPIGHDGKSVNIHHIDQTDTGPLQEISTTDHQQPGIHQNTGQEPSQIDRNAFDKWRTKYWKWRVNDFK